MAFLSDIGTYLAASVTDTALTMGTNLFLGRLPDTPDTCVAVFETSGEGPVNTGGGSTLPAFTQPDSKPWYELRTMRQLRLWQKISTRKFS